MRSNVSMPASSLLRASLPLLLASCFLPLIGGCSKSPLGGPTVRTSNRFQTVVSFAGVPNPNYYYAVAFDDTGNSNRGPVGIDGVTPIGNGVVGGSFRLLVLYHQSQFQLFYRSTPNDITTEQPILGATNLFDTGLSPQLSLTGMSLNVAINLDAQLPDGTYIFPRDSLSTALMQPIAARSLNINVVATNVILTTDTQNGLRKPVDALGYQTLATPVQIDISGTGTYTKSITNEPVGDEKLDVSSTYTTQGDPNYVDFSTIDISNVQIAITRTAQ